MSSRNLRKKSVRGYKYKSMQFVILMKGICIGSVGIVKAGRPNTKDVDVVRDARAVSFLLRSNLI